MVIHAKCSIKRGKFCTTKSLESSKSSGILSNMLCFEDNEDITSCLGLLSKNSHQRLLSHCGFQCLIPAEPKSGFAVASAVTHACWSLCAIRGNTLKVVRNPLTLGALPWITSDFTGGCPPPPSRSLCQRVNLELQFIKFLVILPFTFQLSLHLERGTHHAY